MEANKKVATAQKNKGITIHHVFAAFYAFTGVTCIGIGVAWLRAHTGYKDATIAALGMGAVSLLISILFIYVGKQNKN